MKALGRVVTSQPLIVAIIGLFILFSIIQPNVATVSNAINVGTQASILLIAATGMTFIIMTAGIDISVGSMLYLGAALMASSLGGMPIVVALLIVVAIMALLGALNGVGVAVIGIPAMVMTLATQQAFRGMAGHLTRQQTVTIDPSVRWLGTGQIMGVPVPMIVAVITVIAGHLLLRRTVFGRYVQAVGSSDSAAINAGLPRTAVIVAVYALGGLLGGLAAFIQAGRLGASQPGIGLGFELTVITAVILGGASLAGGKGSVIGAALGALTLALIENGLVLSGASSYIFDMVRGLVLLAAVFATGRPKRFLARLTSGRSAPIASVVRS